MRHVVAWGAPLVAAGAIAAQASAGGDSSMFVDAGRTLLSGHWNHAFSNPGIQVGPLQLAAFGSIGHSGKALAVVLAVATALLLLAATYAVGVTKPLLISAVGLFAVSVGYTRTGYFWGHPADALLPLAWILAAGSARRGHALRAGLLVGLSAGLETWGILGVAVLALAPQRRDAARGAVAAAGVAAALYLPFMLGGHFAMGAYRWHVGAPSLLSRVVPAGTTIGWPLRLAQGAFAVIAGLAAAKSMRHSPHAAWVVPLAVVGARLLVDPLFLPYYSTALYGPVFVGATLLASRIVVLRRRESFA